MWRRVWDTRSVCRREWSGGERTCTDDWVGWSGRSPLGKIRPSIFPVAGCSRFVTRRARAAQARRELPAARREVHSAAGVTQVEVGWEGRSRDLRVCGLTGLAGSAGAETYECVG